MDSNSVMMGFLAFGTVCVLALTIGGVWHSSNERRLTHAERMKALEMGQPLPDDPEVAKVKARYGSLNKNADGVPIPENIRLARTCYKTAFWVAFFGFAAAVPSSLMGGAGVAVALALATGAIGVSGLFCGTYLATQNNNAISATTYKPQGDPDAFDVAGRRG